MNEKEITKDGLAKHLESYPGCILEIDSRCQHKYHRKAGATPETCAEARVAEVVDRAQVFWKTANEQVETAQKCDMKVLLNPAPFNRGCSFNWSAIANKIYTPEETSRALASIPPYCIVCYSTFLGDEELLRDLKK